MIRTLRRVSRLGGFLAIPALCLLLMAAAPALAITIDFEQAPAGAGGTIALTGGGNATGDDIPLGTMTVIGAPTSGVFSISAELDFSTGGGLLGNFIHIILDAPLTIGPATIAGGTVLLDGTFASHTITGPMGTFLSVQGNGPDEKAAGLLAALGIPPGTSFDFFGFTVTADFDATSGTGTATSTDIGNNSRVPQPTNLLLLGIGLSGFGAFAWWRHRQN